MGTFPPIFAKHLPADELAPSAGPDAYQLYVGKIGHEIKEQLVRQGLAEDPGGMWRIRVSSVCADLPGQHPRA
jgi:hypothetical protein